MLKKLKLLEPHTCMHPFFLYRAIKLYKLWITAHLDVPLDKKKLF